jgi:ATP-dependent Clp protease ATP-binding subunit ClpC
MVFCGMPQPRRNAVFSQFSQSAQAVVHLAEQECRNASHYYLGTEHLLLAMAIDPPADARAFFSEIGAAPWEVKQALREAMDPPGEHPWEGVIITPRVRGIFERAAALKTDGARIEPVDILRGIVTDGGGVAARVLAGFGPGKPA